jgi:polar amino acid transport system substrate-binding protein
LNLYGVAGPYAEANAYLDLEAEVWPQQQGALYGGLEAMVGVGADFLGYGIGEYEATVLGYRILLWQEGFNQPPHAASYPFPPDEATNQRLDVDLGWTGGDPDGDDVTYDVYFETDDITPDVLVSDNQRGTTYDPGTLSANTHYYWQIVAEDEHGETTDGPVWDFTTGADEPLPLQVNVATYAHFPPFEYIDLDTNEIIGFDIDLLDAIAENEGLEINYIDVAYNQVIDGMMQCQYDAAISAITISDYLLGYMNFTDPYFASGQIVTTRMSNTDIYSLEDLAGKYIGVAAGTMSEVEANKIPGVILVAFEDYYWAFSTLLEDRIDAVMSDNDISLSYIRQFPDEFRRIGDVITEEKLGIAVCKTHPELLSKLNAGMASIKTDGTYDQLIQRWFPELAP